MKLLDETATGIFVIAVTPFNEDGAIDMDSVDRMTDFYLERGATGLTVLGIMGEAPKLTAGEARAVVKRIIARAGAGVPVVVGVSAPGLAPMRELAHDVMADGAAGGMVAAPGHLRTDDQCFGYFQSVADALGSRVPFVLQDYPLATGVQLAPSVIQRVVDAITTCVMLKHEDWPGLAKITTLRQASDAGRRRISILTGNGALFLPEEIARGADGAMTGFAFPEMMVGVWNAYVAGDIGRGRDIFDAYLPLVRYEQQPGLGLAIRKHILARRGAIASAALRAPGPKLSAADIAEIDLLLRRQEARLKELG
jgi:4-hydroxy-tetrahydrodipicolinate synthase